MSYRPRKQHYISILLTLLLAFITLSKQQGWFTSATINTLNAVQSGTYTVNHFIDGDTIAVNMNGKTETVRLIGIDTPETHKPNTPVQCYGAAAAAYTKNRIGSNSVRLVSDNMGTNRDRYNRLLRYVYLPDGTNLDEALIQNGYAFAYLSFPFTQSKQFSADQQAAKTAGNGLWSSCQPYQESDGRWQTNNAS